MKYIIILTALLVFDLASCNSQIIIDKSGTDKYSSMPCVEPAEIELVKPVKTKTADDSYKVELKGLVEVNETGQVYLVINPSSKSRRTYLVTGELTDKVAGYKGETVTVKCCYLEKRTWSGTIRVYEILK
ncbi:MAG TPA: hypothetical protein PLT13_11045 [Spirochaetota bacterium]|nr:hypothetical protein [Spirochaetota bacterium]